MLMVEENTQYISLSDVKKELGVNRGSVYYFIQHLDIEVRKFELDRNKYILRSDLERIKAARQAAKERKH